MGTVLSRGTCTDRRPRPPYLTPVVHHSLTCLSGLGTRWHCCPVSQQGDALTAPSPESLSSMLTDIPDRCLAQKALPSASSRRYCLRLRLPGPLRTGHASRGAILVGAELRPSGPCRPTASSRSPSLLGAPTVLWAQSRSTTPRAAWARGNFCSAAISCAPLHFPHFHAISVGPQ